MLGKPVSAIMRLRVPWNAGISWLAANQLASQEGVPWSIFKTTHRFIRWWINKTWEVSVMSESLSFCVRCSFDDFLEVGWVLYRAVCFVPPFRRGVLHHWKSIHYDSSKRRVKQSTPHGVKAQKDDSHWIFLVVTKSINVSHWGLVSETDTVSQCWWSNVGWQWQWQAYDVTLSCVRSDVNCRLLCNSTHSPLPTWY